MGNLGLNYKYRATEKEPLHVYSDDFDNSGTNDIVLGYYDQGICFPVRGRQCSSEQIPGLREKFPTYEEFAQAGITDVYGNRPLKKALHYEARLFSSSYIENRGEEGFAILPLPIRAQISPIQALLSRDFNGDGNPDILLSGNFYVSEVETGRADAGIGLLLLGDGKGGFRAAGLSETGFYAPRDVRDMALLDCGPGRPPLVIVANNNDQVQVFRHEAGSREVSF